MLGRLSYFKHLNITNVLHDIDFESAYNVRKYVFVFENGF